MSARVSRSLAIHELEGRGRLDAGCPAHIIAETPQHVIRLHDVDTTFVSTTLFSVNSEVNDAAPRQSQHQNCHQSSSTLLTLPVDGHHLLVACGSETSSRNGVSSVFVLRLHPGGPSTSARNILPIVAISGCVQDAVVTTSTTDIVMMPPDAVNEVAAGQLAESKEAECTTMRSLTVQPSPISSPLLQQQQQQHPFPQAALPAPRVAHTFLLADAVMHAIWAIEVDTGSLKVRVVSPLHYWSRRSRKHSNDTANDETLQQQEQEQHGPQYVPRAKAILGGIQGFVDGPFCVARFSSPTALCWRMDDDMCDNDDVLQHPSLNKKRMTTQTNDRYTVLFVSDTGNHAIRYADFGTKLVRTVSGLDGVPGYRDGAYHVSSLQEAAAMVWCPSTGLLFVDRPNGALRLITGLEKTRVAGEEVTQDSSPLPRVWTVSGGLYGGMSPYIDATEVQRASLGAPSALALMPDGSGVLFADSRHHALRLLSPQGVETLLSPYDYSDHSSFPIGLIACTHIVTCRLLSPGSTPCVAFLVSSGARQAVSLLVPCSHVEGGNIPCHLDLAHLSEISIHPAYCVELAKGVLHKYRRSNGKKRVGQHEAKPAAPWHISHGRKKFSTNGGSRMASFSSSTRRRVLLQAPPSPATLAESGRLEEAERQVLQMYLHYASRTSVQYRMSNIWSCGSGRRLRDLDMTHSLSLLGFWRFLSHTGFFVVHPTLQFSHLSPSTTVAAAAPPPPPPPAAHHLMLSGNDSNRIQCVLQDWRVLTEVLHRISVRQHGYHILSSMGFTFFCRVILLLHSWKQQSGAGGDAERSGINRLPGVSCDALGEKEMLLAYEDAVRGVKAVNFHLHSVMHATEVEEQDNGQKSEEERFMAVDALLQLLVCNEKSLQQLFQAYCKTTVIHLGTSSCEADYIDGAAAMRYLRSVLVPGDEKGYASVSCIPAVAYSGFHALFHAVDVFPTLVSESLLRRAFDDATSSPLFHHLTRDTTTPLTMIIVQEKKKRDEEEEENCLSFDVLASHESQQKSPCGGQTLSFLTFVEAFTRVALTTFSLCGERDQLMYPTAAAKVEALMRWINRSFEMRIACGHAASCKKGESRIGGSTSASQPHTYFPLDFVLFSTPARKAEP